MWRGTLLLFLILGMAGCAKDAPQFTGDALRVESARALPAEPGFNGVVYLEVINPTQEADRLLSVSSSVAEIAQFHESSQEDGVMRMRPRPDGFTIAPETMISLETGGKHIMLVNLQQPLRAGETFQITLTFEQAGEMVVPVSVLSMNEDNVKMDHNHDNHP